MKSRRRAQDGANAVEFALVLPILVVLLMGTFTVGIAYNRWLQMNHSVREGGRFGATLPETTPAWFDEVATRTLETAAGELNYKDSTVALCVSREFSGTITRVTYEGKSSHTTRADFLGTATTTNGTHCFADGLASAPAEERERVQVEAQRQVQFNAVFISLTPTLTTTSVSRFEDRPAPSPSPSP